MSNIYIQEPPTSGKVLLVTSVGDIDVELWCKETPKTCRNFIQLCMEGYYDKTIFHRVVKGFIVQGGDPSGTGEGGESIYNEPFKDEFHSRLRYTRRGLLGMANSGKNDNTSQFFFTFGEAGELNNKNTLFGKITGDTIFNMLKLEECEIDGNERPIYPHKIISTKILNNPFDDIIPRTIAKPSSKHKSTISKKNDLKASKNFKLLSFGEEAEEDENEVDKVTNEMQIKSKSSHDLLKDNALSSVPALGDVEETSDDEDEQKRQDELRESIRSKLKRDIGLPEDYNPSKMRRTDSKSERLFELKEEAKRLRKELNKKNLKPSEEPILETIPQKQALLTNNLATTLEKEKSEFKTAKSKQKGSKREADCLERLKVFQNKIKGAQKMSNMIDANDSDNEVDEYEVKTVGDDRFNLGFDNATDKSWASHVFKYSEQKRKVLDANIDDIDRYELHDPRNPLSKRRREKNK